MWIGWVESNFTNPRIKVWADLDNPFKRNYYAKLCIYIAPFPKGEVSPAHTTMWIGWVESNFTNPIVKVWADLDNPFKRNYYAKLCIYIAPFPKGEVSPYNNVNWGE